jgi:hypothetical protein
MAAIVRSAFSGTPEMREFNVSNDLLGDNAALDAAWDRDGYWFFRDVLDKDAVARLRAVYLNVLHNLGVIESGHNEVAVYNGASLKNYPITMGGDPSIDPLLALHPRDQFVTDPKIKAFFEGVFGDEVFWVPNTEYHAVPPSRATPVSRFNFVHADGPSNKGLPLKVCWIPLAPIDEAIGGLALTEGLHKPRMNDFPRLSSGINATEVPVDAWRRFRYQPGDVVIFSLESPHSGLANLSDRYFRLSMDIRGMRKSDGVPVVGSVTAIDRCAITVRDESGAQHTFRIDEDTFCRIYRGKLSGMPLKLDEIPQLLVIGAQVYIASNRGTATFIRPQH